MEAGGGCCDLTFKNKEVQEEEEGEQVTASRAALFENRVDAAVAAVLSALDGTFASQKEQRTSLKAVLRGKDVLTLLPSVFSKCLVKHGSTAQRSRLSCGFQRDPLTLRAAKRLLTS